MWQKVTKNGHQCNYLDAKVQIKDEIDQTAEKENESVIIKMGPVLNTPY